MPDAFFGSASMRQTERHRAPEEERDPKVTLYGTSGCHLCDQAEELLRSFLGEDEFLLADIAMYEPLLERYGLRIPVLKRMQDDRELDWPFDPGMLGSFLELL